jgi:GTP-binding protein HflX
LLTLIDRELPLDPLLRATFRLPASEGSLIHLLHERARVLSSRYEGDCCEIEAEVPESVKRRLTDYIVE